MTFLRLIGFGSLVTEVEIAKQARNEALTACNKEADASLALRKRLTTITRLTHRRIGGHHECTD